ncbi:MAG: zinc ribbon domain-containing protein [Clostridia bacterium]|nr:zinc ribbon domain-containing protein [Clostridia bacterium]
MSLYPYFFYDQPPIGDLNLLTDMLITAAVISAVIAAAIAVLSIVIYWKMFKKAGQPGWIALIPFYNIWKMFELATGHGAYMLLLFVPIANFIVLIYFYVKLSVAYSQDEAFCIGLIFLPIIFLAILAFGKKPYVGPQGRVSADPNGRYYRNYAGTQYGPAPGRQYGQYGYQQQPYTRNYSGQTRVTSNFCPNCGAPIQNTRFCGNCGYDIFNNR